MNYIAYYRVSRVSSRTGKGLDGYGIAAQKQAVSEYLARIGGQLLGSFEEVESGSNNRRPQLLAALAMAFKLKAILIIGKLDRLSRNAAFLLTLQDSGVQFIAVDQPQLDRFMVGILGLCAQRELEMTSTRIKQALAVCRQRGVTLGNPRLSEARINARRAVQERKQRQYGQALIAIREIQSTNVSSLSKISNYLNLRGTPSVSGKAGKWTTTAVSRVLKASVLFGA